MTKPTSILLQLSDNSQVELVNDLLNKSNIAVIDKKTCTKIPSQAPIISNLITTNLVITNIVITHFVDGRGLACPQPLLKTKMALRKMASSQPVHDGFVYMVATDPNSQVDLQAFAKQGKQQLSQWQSENLADSSTIFHFLIQSKSKANQV